MSAREEEPLGQHAPALTAHHQRTFDAVTFGGERRSSRACQLSVLGGCGATRLKHPWHKACSAMAHGPTPFIGAKGGVPALQPAGCVECMGDTSIAAGKTPCEREDSDRRGSTANAHCTASLVHLAATKALGRSGTCRSLLV